MSRWHLSLESAIVLWLSAGFDINGDDELIWVITI
jgi:hypothetical protein